MRDAARVAAAIELQDALAPSLAERFAPPADRVAADWFRSRRYIGAKDRTAIHSLVYGVIRARARLDWWIARAGPALAATGCHVGLNPRARTLAYLVLAEGLGRAEVQALFSGGQFAPPPLSNAESGFLDILVRTPPEGRRLNADGQPAAVRAELPDWLYTRIAADIPASERAAEFAALAEPAALDLRVNGLKCESREQARRVLAEARISAQPTALSPHGLRVEARVNLMATEPWKDGLVEVQDEGSQIVAALVDAQPGLRVVDFCAGAGGKTLALAAAMANRGRLVACDIAAQRSEAAVRRLRRAGVSNVERRVLSSERDPWVKRHKAGFDRVLVDAPCSGTGTFRRNPDGKWRLAPEDVSELTQLQAAILASAARLVRPGGRLIYATCSLLPEENHGQVVDFLKGHPDFTVLPVEGLWPQLLPGPLPAGAAREGMLHLSPARHGTDGFFCAVLERTAAATNETVDEDGEAPEPSAKP